MSEPASLIVNGKNGSIEIWPWTAAIFTSTSGKCGYRSSGTLITNKHVVTSASDLSYTENDYLVPLTLKRVKVYLGVSRLDDDVAPDALISANPTWFIYHPKLKEGRPRIANVAIIELDI